jgi:hypothetical protein
MANMKVGHYNQREKYQEKKDRNLLTDLFLNRAPANGQ